MTPSVLVVAKTEDGWGVSDGRELLALTKSEIQAFRLAESAAQILRDGGGKARVVMAREPRSFQDDG